MAGLIRRIFVWQLAPLRSRAQDPQHPVEHLPSVLPRTSTAIGTALGLQQRLQLRPLPLSHLPASSHPRLEDPPALVLLCRYSCQTARRKKFQTIYETGPSGMERVILKALQKNPAERHQSASELLAELRRLSAAKQQRASRSIDSIAVLPFENENPET